MFVKWISDSYLRFARVLLKEVHEFYAVSQYLRTEPSLQTVERSHYSACRALPLRNELEWHHWK